GARSIEPCDKLLQAQLLQPARDRVELRRAVLHQVPALLDQVERLSQSGVARVEPADDLLDPRDGRLVGALLGHSTTRAVTRPSRKRRPTVSASRAAAAEPTGSPAASSTSAYPRAKVRSGSWAASASASRSSSPRRRARSGPAARAATRPTTSRWVEASVRLSSAARLALARSPRRSWCRRRRWRAT